MSSVEVSRKTPFGRAITKNLFTLVKALQLISISSAVLTKAVKIKVRFFPKTSHNHSNTLLSFPTASLLIVKGRELARIP